MNPDLVFCDFPLKKKNIKVHKYTYKDVQWSGPATTETGMLHVPCQTCAGAAFAAGSGNES